MICVGMVLVKLLISMEAMHLRLCTVAEDGKYLREEPTEMEKISTWASWLAAAC